MAAANNPAKPSAKKPTPAGAGFLSFNSLPPRVHVTADDDTFDETTLRRLREEGFDVTYLPMDSDARVYRDKLRHLADDLELGENYAIVAYGDAATVCLEAHIKPQPHLAALITYYPTTIQSPKAKYPSQLQFQCHIASKQGFAPAFPHHIYPKVDTGFAEHDLETFNKTAAAIAWTRTLGALRKGFKIEVELEPVRNEQLAYQFASKQAAPLMQMMCDDAHVTNVPTLTGGIGQKDLFIFYRDFFTAKNPPSLQVKLVSRTVGVDRVVDEMVVSFKHTHEVPWMLPEVPPTDKVVHIAVVSIICVRGGLIYHEHVYWDQASVLVQIGLLDPKMVPDSMKGKGLKRLPVHGSESAARVLDEASQPSNELISGWKSRPRGDPGVLPSRPKSAADGKAG